MDGVRIYEEKKYQEKSQRAVKNESGEEEY